MLLVAQTVYRLIIRWLVSNELKILWTEAVEAYLRYYWRFIRFLRKIKKVLIKADLPKGRDLNTAPSE
jgi:hypothetical protein